MPPFPFRQLLDWYRENGRHRLPWRQYFGLPVRELSYHVYLSEILLQQTQVDRVIGYYKDILTHFPTKNRIARGKLIRRIFPTLSVTRILLESTEYAPSSQNRNRRI